MFKIIFMILSGFISWKLTNMYIFVRERKKNPVLCINCSNYNFYQPKQYGLKERHTCLRRCKIKTNHVTGETYTEDNSSFCGVERDAIHIVSCFSGTCGIHGRFYEPKKEVV